MANTELSKKIKELRLKRGMSQDQLADITGLSLRTVQRVESGQNIPRGDTLSRLASAFKVSTEEIVELQNHENGHEDNHTGKGSTKFFDNWPRLLYFFILSLFIFVVGLYFKCNLISMIWLFVCVVELLILTYSIIYQFSKRRWMAGILTSIIVFLSLFLFIGLFTLDTTRIKEVKTRSYNK